MASYGAGFIWRFTIFRQVLAEVWESEDRGLVLLDPRVQRQRYGQTFWQSLPPYHKATMMMDVEDFF